MTVECTEGARESLSVAACDRVRRLRRCASIPAPPSFSDMPRSAPTRRTLALTLALAAIEAGFPARAQSPTLDTTIAEDLSERVTRATALVLVDNALRARGVVISGDGRVVTALAPLRDHTEVTLRYPDGRTDAAAVVATDPVWGLALLQPRGGYWRESLPIAIWARGNTPARWVAGDEPRSVAGLFRRRRTFVGRDSVLLRDALEFDPAPAESAIGSGVANRAGELIAIVVPPDPTVPAGGANAPFGAPGTAVRELLARAGVTARAWIGLTGRDLRAGEGGPSAAEGGVLVTRLAPGGPAERAGVHAGPHADVVIGIDDRRVRSTADLGEALQSRRAGERVLLRLLRDGAPVEIQVELDVAPEQRP